MRRSITPVLLAALLSLSTVLVPFAVAQGGIPVPNPGCSPDVVPIGQANPPGSQLEPMRPIWCFTLNPAGNPTRVTGANDWEDNFDATTPVGSFESGNYDYSIFNAIMSGCTNFRSQHFTNASHWMSDEAGASTCGTMLRPNKSFHFENGALIVEQDVAAGISGYASPGTPTLAFAEIDVSMGDHPTGDITDPLYGYGQFGGFWTVGCRLQIAGEGPWFTRSSICSVESALHDQPNNAASCNAASPSRTMEISAPGPCGSVHSGGVAILDQSNWRVCDSVAQSPDLNCRDRFRMEIRQNGLKLYVNGALFFEDSNWPANKQLPASAVNGNWFVYATDWESNSASNTAYRFHWDRFAVNPHNPDGSPAGLTASPSFCPGQPHKTCPPSTTPTNTPVPAATNTPTPTPTNTPVPPTNTPTPTPTNTPVPAATNTPTPTNTPVPAATATPTNTPVPATCEVWVRINGVEQWLAKPVEFCQ